MYNSSTKDLKYLLKYYEVLEKLRYLAQLGMDQEIPGRVCWTFNNLQHMT
jgi:hypothetical protein